MKFAIKLGDSYYYDGTNPNGIFDTAGFVSEKVAFDRATVWESRERVEAILRQWWDCDGNPKHKDTWHCVIDGQSVGKFNRIVEDVDRGAKRILFIPNTNARPELVEIEDDLFGRPSWSEKRLSAFKLGDYEYKHQYMLYGMSNERNGWREDLPSTYPEAIALHIPEYEVDGWEFVGMANDSNALFRRRRKVS